MPRLSAFYGIAISMFYDDHDPPHFHAAYAGQRILVGIEPMRVIVGASPRRAESLVMEWSVLHQQELMEAWQRARDHRSLQRIAPLE
jgi:hypothetical protein